MLAPRARALVVDDFSAAGRRPFRRRFTTPAAADDAPGADISRMDADDAEYYADGDILHYIILYRSAVTTAKSPRQSHISLAARFRH